MNLAQTILGVTFDNPTVLASGILGITASTWKLVAKNGAGAITTKSIWLKEHKGHRNPTIISTEHWTLNAVGVPDAGPEKAREEIGEFMKDKPVPLIINLIAETVENYGKTAEALLPPLVTEDRVRRETKNAPQYAREYRRRRRSTRAGED